jgi:hypothetical protein
MIYPTKMEANGHIYPINTDYRYALACFRAINDCSITQRERYYAVQTILLGEDVLEEDEPILQKKIETYLRCGKEENTSIDEIDMDYFQDESLIRTSIKQVYHGLDIIKENIHWWEYNELISGLTEDSILNRVRDLRSYDISEETDEKRRRKIIEAQERVTLKINVPETEEKKEMDEFWNNILR